jgi:hypothetical protein
LGAEGRRSESCHPDISSATCRLLTDQKLAREHRAQLLEVVLALRGLSQCAHIGLRGLMQGAVVESRGLEDREGGALDCRGN